MKKILLITTFLFSISLHAESMSAQYDNKARSARNKMIATFCIQLLPALVKVMYFKEKEAGKVHRLFNTLCLFSMVYYFGKKRAFTASKNIALEEETAEAEKEPRDTANTTLLLLNNLQTQ